MERDNDCEGQFLRNLLTDFETDESTHFIIAIFFPVQNDNDFRRRSVRPSVNVNNIFVFRKWNYAKFRLFKATLKELIKHTNLGVPTPLRVTKILRCQIRFILSIFKVLPAIDIFWVIRKNTKRNWGLERTWHWPPVIPILKLEKY